MLLTEVPANKIEKIGWLDMQGSVRNVYIGKVVGGGLVGKDSV